MQEHSHYAGLDRDPISSYDLLLFSGYESYFQKLHTDAVSFYREHLGFLPGLDPECQDAQTPIGAIDQ
jgi:hypothetical protein